MKVYASMDQSLPSTQVAAHAQRAESMGYEGLYVPEAVHDGFLTSILALEHTSALKVATSVVLAFPRSPMTIAYAAWDLQTFSGGRFELGLGTQIKANMEGRYSVEWKPPVARMRDYVNALRAIFDCWQNGTKLVFQSEHYQFTRMQPFFKPEPLESGAIPIHLGGVNRKITELVGEVADGMMTHPTNTNPRYLRELTVPALKAGLERAGRPADAAGVMAAGFTATGIDDEAVQKAREGVREYLTFLFSTPQYWPTLELHGWEDVGHKLRQLTREGRWGEMQGAITDDMLDQLVPTGSYNEIGQILRDWYGELTVGVTFPMPDDPVNDDAAAEVIRDLRS